MPKTKEPSSFEPVPEQDQIEVTQAQKSLIQIQKDEGELRADPTQIKTKGKPKGPKRTISALPYTPYKWVWPLEVSRYDRNPVLSEAEFNEMQILINRFDAGGKNWHNQAYVTLDRLLQPLYAALDQTGATSSKVLRKATVRHTAINLIIRAMHRRNCSFWAFSNADWIDLFGVTYYAYLERNGDTANCRQYLIALAYLLCGFDQLEELGILYQYNLAIKVFTPTLVDSAVNSVEQELLIWGYSKYATLQVVFQTLCKVLLTNRSPRLEDIKLETLELLYTQTHSRHIQKSLVKLSYILVRRGFIPKALGREGRYSKRVQDLKSRRALKGMSRQWAEWCQKWYDLSTLQPSSRVAAIYRLFQIGRWLEAAHPDIVSPAQWTRELAAECVGMIDKITVGQWSDPGKMFAASLGKPIKASSKNGFLGSLRVFFRDLQEWELIERRFNPPRVFATPRSIRAKLETAPRTIADDIWAKLVWAGLNLKIEDIPFYGFKPNPSQPAALEPQALADSQFQPQPNKQPTISFYPVEMVQAVALLWLFGGLRRDEIIRLRVGAVRWQAPQAGTPSSSSSSLPATLNTPSTESGPLPENSFVKPTQARSQPADPAASSARTVCLLDIPVNKTSGAFTKPVDSVVGEALEKWEKVRPIQPAMLDAKTGELVQYLFSYRGKQIGKAYLNNKMIPLLCKKAGVEAKDARGPITSHHARSTIASQLYNAKEPMTLFELMEWLGHTSPASTQHYTRISPTKLIKAYSDSNYFGRNLRTIEVLLDQDVIKSGAAANGEAWKYYDLGHGYCTYDFFDQCLHRMACAKCSFYRPKGSSAAQILEARANLVRMRQEIPLSDDERSAVEDGLEALEKLSQKLLEVPTPAGPTPSQLLAEELAHKRHLPIASPQIK